MRVFVVGGTGVLGRAAVPVLVAAGHEVAVTVRRPAAADVVRAAGATPVATDVFDRRELADAAAAFAPHVVVRLATHVPIGGAALLPGAWRQNHRLRRELAAHLADVAIAQDAAYVGESLVLAYPDSGAGWIDAATPVAPVGPVASVADAEAAVDRVAASGRRGVSLRFGLFHGADTGQSELTLDTARRGWLAMPGAPDGYVSHVALADAAAAVALALELPSGVYDVVEDDPATRAAHAAALAAVVGRRVRHPPRLLGRIPRVGPVARSLRVDNARLREHGWRPTVPSTVAAWADVAAAAA